MTSGDAKRTAKRVITVLVVAVGLLFAFGWISSELNQRFDIDRVDTFATLVTGMLSLVLIGVYLQQNDILDAHSTILRAEHRPVVSVVDRSVGVESPSSIEQEVSTDHVVLELQNSGNEVALDMRLYCHVEYNGESNQPISSNAVRLDQPETGPNTIESRGGVLPADNTSQQFYGLVEYENGNYGYSIDTHDKELPFTIAISQLLGKDSPQEDSSGDGCTQPAEREDNNSVSEVTVAFLVIFDNTIGDQFAVGINPAYQIAKSDVDATVPLEELSECAEKYYLEEVIDASLADELDIPEENMRL